MKTTKTYLTALAGICAACLIVAAALTAFAQTAPVLTIAPAGTNMLVTITNGVNGLTYDLVWTPVLANPAYPWKTAVVGTNGQTNFTVNMSVWQAQFYRAVIDTNSIPLYELADPNNPSAGILAVFIDSPTNGTLLQ